MAEIRELDDQNQVVKEEAPKEIGTPDKTISKELSLENIAIAQVFGMEIKELEKNKEGLDVLVKWVKTQTDDLEPMNIKWVIRNLEDRLGSPPITEKRIDQVIRYATLDLQSKQIEREKESLLNK